MRRKLTITDDDDETREILLDGESMISVNHDDHGWSGMEAACETAKAIATKMGWQIEEG